MEEVLFKNREEAGENLAKELEKYKGEETIILAIPRGGVAVAYPIAKALKTTLDVIVLRKLPIPGNPEMGFGAMLGDGTILLNDEAVKMFNLTQAEIDQTVKEVLKEIKRREKIYRGIKPFPKLEGKTVILVDDGIATGYTMLAAIKFVKIHSPQKIVIASPVCAFRVADKIKKQVDEYICFYSQTEVSSFAVASYYEEFPDLTDDEVLAYLIKVKSFSPDNP